MLTHQEALTLRDVLFSTFEDYVTVVAYEPDNSKPGVKRPNDQIYFLIIMRKGEKGEHRFKYYVYTMGDFSSFLRIAFQKSSEKP